MIGSINNTSVITPKALGDSYGGSNTLNDTENAIVAVDEDVLNNTQEIKLLFWIEQIKLKHQNIFKI